MEVPTPPDPHLSWRTATYSFGAPLEILPEKWSLWQPRERVVPPPAAGPHAGSKKRSTASVTSADDAAAAAAMIAPPLSTATARHRTRAALKIVQL
jgi:hypothetical protein